MSAEPRLNDRIRPWQIRLRAVSHRVTWFLGRRFPETFPFVFVLGFPKSGTTWACQLLADYLQLPFPRYSLLPVGCPAVVHGHELVDPRYPRGVYVMRDGRDVMVSSYFFALRHVPDTRNPHLPRHVRQLVGGPIADKNDIRSNLPRMIEHAARRGPKRNWAGHVRSFLEAQHDNFVAVRYEDLLDDGVETLAGVAGSLTGEAPDAERAGIAICKFSFSRQRDRLREGEQGPKFLRRGRAGDWRNHFTREAAELFDRHFGDVLIAAGYEKNASWAASVP